MDTTKGKSHFQCMMKWVCGHVVVMYHVSQFCGVAHVGCHGIGCKEDSRVGQMTGTDPEMATTSLLGIRSKDLDPTYYHIIYTSTSTPDVVNQGPSGDAFYPVDR